MKLNTAELHEVSLLLAERLKIDYTNFNDGFMRRRLDYLFEKMGFRRIQDLKDALGSLPRFNEMAYYLSLPSTELFRSPSFWRALLRCTLEQKVETIWLPCLSSYHELYSLLIILSMNTLDNVRITANVTSDKIMQEVLTRQLSKKEDEQDKSNFERLETPFAYDDFVRQEELGPKLREGLLDKVSFRNGWFLNFPTDEKYDVIIFRDILLSYNRKLHRMAVDNLVEHLNGSGALLCLGLMEKPLTADESLSDKYASEGIYTLY